jgi:hypothetical protein
VVRQERGVWVRPRRRRRWAEEEGEEARVGNVAGTVEDGIRGDEGERDMRRKQGGEAVVEIDREVGMLSGRESQCVCHRRRKGRKGRPSGAGWETLNEWTRGRCMGRRRSGGREKQHEGKSYRGRNRGLQGKRKRGRVAERDRERQRKRRKTKRKEERTGKHDEG